MDDRYIGRETVNQEDVRRTISLFHDEGQVFEIRIPKYLKPGERKTRIPFPWAGYFDNADDAVLALTTQVGWAEAIYITFNQINPDLILRSPNELKPGKNTTADKEVTRRRNLIIDIDGDRPAGISATDEEVELSRVKVMMVKDWLSEMGFPVPAVAMSGNGYHLIYRLDMPNDKESTKLVNSFLLALDSKYRDADNHVDSTLSNASRIIKVYGTWARKGAEGRGRIHRLARTESIPDERQVVPAELLRKVIAEIKGTETPKAEPSVKRISIQADSDWDIREWCNEKGVAIKADDGEKIHVVCPWAAGHSSESDKEASILIQPSGAVVFKCFHNHCSGRTWRDFRLHYEPDAYDRVIGGRPGGVTVHKAVRIPDPPQARPKQSADPVWLEAVASSGSRQCDLDDPSTWGVLSADKLNAMEVKPTEWIADGIIPPGLVMLAAGEKVGKSIMAQQLALSVVTGEPFLGHFAITQRGEAWYLALEQGSQQTRNRLARTLDGRPVPQGLYVTTLEGWFEPLDSGGMTKLEAWMGHHPDTKVIILDVWEDVRPLETPRSKDPYQLDMHHLRPLHAWATKHEVALVIILHHNKAGEGFMRIQGSRGQQAKVCQVVNIEREIDQPIGIVQTKSRDGAHIKFSATFDGGRARWSYLSEEKEGTMTAERRQIVSILNDSPEPVSASDIQGMLKDRGTIKSVGTVKNLLTKMRKDGQISVVEGRGNQPNRYSIVPGALDSTEGLVAAAGCLPDQGRSHTAADPSRPLGNCEHYGLFGDCDAPVLPETSTDTRITTAEVEDVPNWFEVDDDMKF